MRQCSSKNIWPKIFGQNCCKIPAGAIFFPYVSKSDIFTVLLFSNKSCNEKYLLPFSFLKQKHLMRKTNKYILLDLTSSCVPRKCTGFYHIGGVVFRVSAWVNWVEVVGAGGEGYTFDML